MEATIWNRADKAEPDGDERPFPTKRWDVAETPAGTEALAAKLGTNRLIAGLLIRRGITDPAAGKQFLRPTLKDLHEPSTLPGLNEAAERLAKAVKDKEKIVIYGDYDVDGIAATSILWHAIRTLGGDPHTYIPHRLDEGYGLNDDALRQIIDDGADLIVTVDCGITAVDAATLAKDRGVDLIITDHHDFREPLPEAIIVHPRLPTGGEPYENPHLCGAGVAFKLAWGVGQKLTGGKVTPALRQFLVEATSLAALATVADVVPLIGENRVLTRFGLDGLKHTSIDGLQALITAAGLDGKDIDSMAVGFKLGPRLNACGRMGHAREAVELLTVATPERGAEIAGELESANRQRQQTERQITDEAAACIGDPNGCQAIVVDGDNWHPGVVGIVAGRLKDRFHRPAVVLCRDAAANTATGSARGIEGFHLAEHLSACGEHLTKHGGHAMAAGLSLNLDALDAFRQAFLQRAADALSPDDLVPRLKIDAEVTLDELTPALVKDLARLEPFGAGNPRVMFVVKGASLDTPPRPVGKTGDHLQLRLRQGRTVTKGIAFGAGPWLPFLRAGQKLDVAGVPSLNHWNGQTSVEFEVKDIRPAE
jgi:single-stranded-DNA-specific exonuclease